jgi:hypothetical protein
LATIDPFALKLSKKAATVDANPFPDALYDDYRPY